MEDNTIFGIIQQTLAILEKEVGLAKSTLDFLKKLTGKDFTICPRCGIGHLSRASPEKIETT